MVLSWLGGSKQPASVSDLVARRKYGKAVDLLMAQFREGSRDPRLQDPARRRPGPRGQGGRRRSDPDRRGRRVRSRDGFAAKAIAVLKRIEKVEPPLRRGQRLAD
jgi:hypothetical protein